MDIGKTINIGLRKKGLSQVKLAKALGVSPPTVANWISNKRKPDAEKLLQIINLLDLVPEFFPEYKEDTSDDILCKLEKLNDRVTKIEKQQQKG